MKWLRDGAISTPGLSRALAKCPRCGKVVTVYLRGWTIAERYPCNCRPDQHSALILTSRDLAESSAKMGSLSQEENRRVNETLRKRTRS